MASFSSLPIEIRQMIVKSAIRVYTFADLPEDLLLECRDTPNSHRLIRAYRKKHDGRHLALVCREWAEVVHCRALELVYLSDPSRIAAEVAFLRDSVALRRHNKTIEME